MAVLEALQQGIKRFRDCTDKIAATEKEIAAKKSELESLQKQHKELQQQQERVQHALLTLPAGLPSELAGAMKPDPFGKKDTLSNDAKDFAKKPPQPQGPSKRDTLLGEQKDVAAKVSAATSQRATIEAKLQSLQQELVQEKRNGQKLLKDAFLALKQAVEKVHATPSTVIRLMVLAELDATVKKQGLQPQGLDELFDKAFASDILNSLVRVGDQARSVLDLQAQGDIDRWRDLPNEIESSTKSVRSQEENLRTLPGRLDQTKASLAQAQTQHEQNAELRENLGTQAKWSFLAALGFGAILGGLGATVAPPALFGLVLPGLLAIYALVQYSRSAGLDYSAQIDQLNREAGDLSRQVDNMPQLQATLARDKSQLADKTREFDDIHARRPELRGFVLARF